MACALQQPFPQARPDSAIEAERRENLRHIETKAGASARGWNHRADVLLTHGPAPGADASNSEVPPGSGMSAATIAAQPGCSPEPLLNLPIRTRATHPTNLRLPARPSALCGI